MKATVPSCKAAITSGMSSKSTSMPSRRQTSAFQRATLARVRGLASTQLLLSGEHQFVEGDAVLGEVLLGKAAVLPVAHDVDLVPRRHQGLAGHGKEFRATNDRVVDIKADPHGCLHQL